MTMFLPDRREASPACKPREEMNRYTGALPLFSDDEIAARAAAQPEPPGLWLPSQQLQPAILPDRLPLAYGGQLPTAADFPADRLTTNMATLPTMPTRWLWGSGQPLPDGRLVQFIPIDELTVIAAKGGTGKGFMMALIAAVITRGWPFPYMPAETACTPGDVLIVAPEDNPITALGPRLISAGADRSRIHDLTLLQSGEPFSLPSSFDMLVKAAGQFPELRAIIIDPIAACVDYQLTSVWQARRVLEPLVQFAAERGIAIIVTAHLTRDGKVHGSPAVVDTPRYVWMIDRDERNTKLRRFMFHKGNNIEGGQGAQFLIRDDGFGPRAIFVDRESVRAQRLKPMIQAALDYQREHAGQQNGAYQITDLPARAITAGAGGTSAALDRAAAALAAQMGSGWDAATDEQRDRYRDAARKMLAAK